MAYPTVDAPYGLQPINRVDGLPYAGAIRQIPIASTYNRAIYNGDIVNIVAGGTIQKSNVTVSSTCFTNQNIPMTQQAGSGLVAPTLFDCVTPGATGTRTLEIYTYKGFVILPGTCSTFKFWWSDCCRPGNITNIFTSNGAFGNDGFFFDADLNNTFGNNSSPIFVSEPVRAF